MKTLLCVPFLALGLTLGDTLQDRSVKAHDGWSRCLAYSADGTTLVTGGSDGELHVWNPADASRRHSFTAGGGP